MRSRRVRREPLGWWLREGGGVLFALVLGFGLAVWSAAGAASSGRDGWLAFSLAALAGLTLFTAHTFILWQAGRLFVLDHEKAIRNRRENAARWRLLIGPTLLLGAAFLVSPGLAQITLAGALGGYLAPASLFLAAHLAVHHRAIWSVFHETEPNRDRGSGGGLG